MAVIQVNVAQDFKVYNICRSGDLGTRNWQYIDIKFNVSQGVKVYLMSQW